MWILGDFDICIYIYIYIYIYIHTCMNTYQPFAAVSQLPAALRPFSKNDAPGFLNTHIVNLVMFHQFEGPCFFVKKWAICSNDYASKTRTEILCKKTCYIAPYHFPKLDF